MMILRKKSSEELNIFGVDMSKAISGQKEDTNLIAIGSGRIKKNL